MQREGAITSHTHTYTIVDTLLTGRHLEFVERVEWVESTCASARSSS